MSEKLDAPILFEGVVFIQDEDGRTAEVSVTFGYGAIPTADAVGEMVKEALAQAREATGKDWIVPKPREFMARAAQREYGQRVAIGGPMDEVYTALDNAEAGQTDGQGENHE